MGISIREDKQRRSLDRECFWSIIYLAHFSATQESIYNGKSTGRVRLRGRVRSEGGPGAEAATLRHQAHHLRRLRRREVQARRTLPSRRLRGENIVDARPDHVQVQLYYQQ